MLVTEMHSPLASHEWSINDILIHVPIHQRPPFQTKKIKMILHYISFYNINKTFPSKIINQ